MSQSFDLIVLGTGVAGLSAANKCAAAGWSVAVADELPYGGTCVLRGCDPKKMLRRGAEIIDAARLMRGKGVDLDGLKINWPELVAFKRTFTGSMPERIESSLKKKGVTTCHGPARFVNENTLEIGDEHLLGPEYAELINLFGIAIRLGLKTTELSLRGIGSRIDDLIPGAKAGPLIGP